MSLLLYKESKVRVLGPVGKWLMRKGNDLITRGLTAMPDYAGKLGRAIGRQGTQFKHVYNTAGGLGVARHAGRLLDAGFGKVYKSNIARILVPAIASSYFAGRAVQNNIDNLKYGMLPHLPRDQAKNLSLGSPAFNQEFARANFPAWMIEVQQQLPQYRDQFSHLINSPQVQAWVRQGTTGLQKFQQAGPSQWIQRGPIMAGPPLPNWAG